jgi:hypothetical protein
MSTYEEQEAEAAALRAEKPQWEVWRGIDGLWHARWPGHQDPEGRPVMAWGEDPDDLRDQIRRVELYQERSGD